MSAERLRRIGASIVAGFIAGGAAAQDAEPDMDFLEYLGTWDASDEDWMVIRELASAGPAPDIESDPRPVAADDESTEPKNES